MEAIDRLHTTAESHHRTLVVEVMGRHAGWIALHAGLAGGANVILLPERHFDVEQVAGYVEKRFKHQYAPIVVVAEGAQPLEGQMVVHNQELDPWPRPPRRHRPVARRAAGGEDRQGGPHVVLGHIQRGGTPTAFDRVWPPASACRPSTRCTRATSARWWRCRHRHRAGPPDDAHRSSRPSRSSATPRPRSSSAPERPVRPPWVRTSAAARGFGRGERWASVAVSGPAKWARSCSPGCCARAGRRTA